MELVAAIQYHDNKTPLAITDGSENKIEYQNKLLKSEKEARKQLSTDKTLAIHNNVVELSLYEPRSFYSRGSNNLLLHSLLSQNNIFSKWFIRVLETIVRLREERSNT
jgi:hypothetical protein